MATKIEQQYFLNTIIPMAIRNMQDTKVLASLTIAQAILESGWGLSGLTKVSNNLFGIKGNYNGSYVDYPTKEWVNGAYVDVVAQFKKYPSWQESIDDHGNLFTRLARYSNLIGETDYKEVCRKVKEDGYATSPTYTESLINLIEQYKLYAHDVSTVSTMRPMLFAQDNRVEYQYCVYGAASGRSHHGIDVDTTSTDKRVLSTVSGKVVSSTIITDKNNLTWEWGNYVCILDGANKRHYFCHLASRSVSVGQTMTVGQEVGIMGMTGNAAYDKQAEHVHYEVRVSPYGSANHIDPTPYCNIPNSVGTYYNQTKPEPPAEVTGKLILKSFGNKNMQGFNFPDASGQIIYDYMPVGYRLVTERQIKGADGLWEWVKLLDERNGNAIYTPLLDDRNQLLADLPTLIPEKTNTADFKEAITSARVTLAAAQQTVIDAERTLSDLGVT